MPLTKAELGEIISGISPHLDYDQVKKVREILQRHLAPEAEEFDSNEAWRKAGSDIAKAIPGGRD